MRKKETYIACPYCGREYLPAEIFVPTNFLGKPSDIEKDPVGKIVSYTGSSMDTTETYICDGCNSPFTVFAKVQFQATMKDKMNFNVDHITDINKPKISLKEE